MPENWNEIGNEIEGQEGVTNSCPQQPTCTFGRAWVAIKPLEDVKVLFEELLRLNEFLFDHCIVKCRPMGDIFFLQDNVYVNEFTILLLISIVL